MPTVLIARTGETVYVNAAYTTFLGCNAEDLLDLGWKNFIEPGALPALVTEWEAFRNSDKEWFHTTTVFLAKGSTQNCTIIAVRIPADGYAAFIVPVECAKRMMHLCPGTPG